MSDTRLEAPTPSSAAAKPAAYARRRRFRPRPGQWFVAGFLLLVAFIPLNTQDFWDNFGGYAPLPTAPWVMSNGLRTFGLVIAALGLTLLVGQAGQLSLGHSFFVLVGAFTYAVLAGETERTAGHYWVGLNWPPLLAAVAAVLMAGFMGLLFSPIAARLRGIYLGIASLGLVFLGQHVLLNILPDLSGGFQGRGVERFSLFGFRFANPRSDADQLYLFGVPLNRQELLWYLFLVVTVGAYLYYRNLVKGRPGRALRAVRDRELMAEIMGVPVVRYKGYAFLISSMYAGLGGVLYALAFPSVISATTFDFLFAVELLAMVVIGGLGSGPGAVVGAIVVGSLATCLQKFAESGSVPLLNLVVKNGSDGRGLIPAGVASTYLYGAVLVVLLLVEPGGAAAVGRRTAHAVRRLTAGSVRKDTPKK